MAHKCSHNSLHSSVRTASARHTVYLPTICPYIWPVNTPVVCAAVHCPPPWHVALPKPTQANPSIGHLSVGIRALSHLIKFMPDFAFRIAFASPSACSKPSSLSSVIVAAVCGCEFTVDSQPSEDYYMHTHTCAHNNNTCRLLAFASRGRAGARGGVIERWPLDKLASCDDSLLLGQVNALNLMKHWVMGKQFLKIWPGGTLVNRILGECQKRLRLNPI